MEPLFAVPRVSGNDLPDLSGGDGGAGTKTSRFTCVRATGMRTLLAAKQRRFCLAEGDA